MKTSPSYDRNRLLKLYALESITGLVCFSSVAFSAFVIHMLVELLVSRDTPVFVLIAMQIAEYLILSIGVFSLLAILIKTTFSTLSSIKRLGDEK